MGTSTPSAAAVCRLPSTERRTGFKRLNPNANTFSLTNYLTPMLVISLLFVAAEQVQSFQEKLASDAQTSSMEDLCDGVFLSKIMHHMCVAAAADGRWSWRD